MSHDRSAARGRLEVEGAVCRLDERGQVVCDFQAPKRSRVTNPVDPRGLTPGCVVDLRTGSWACHGHPSDGQPADVRSNYSDKTGQLWAVVGPDEIVVPATRAVAVGAQKEPEEMELNPKVGAIATPQSTSKWYPAIVYTQEHVPPPAPLPGHPPYVILTQWNEKARLRIWGQDPVEVVIHELQPVGQHPQHTLPYNALVSRPGQQRSVDPGPGPMAKIMGRAAASKNPNGNGSQPPGGPGVFCPGCPPGYGKVPVPGQPCPTCKKLIYAGVTAPPGNGRGRAAQRPLTKARPEMVPVDIGCEIKTGKWECFIEAGPHGCACGSSACCCNIGPIEVCSSLDDLPPAIVAAVNAKREGTQRVFVDRAELQTALRRLTQREKLVPLGAGCQVTTQHGAFCWITSPGISCIKIGTNPWACCVESDPPLCASAELPPGLSAAIERIPAGQTKQVWVTRDVLRGLAPEGTRLNQAQLTQARGSRAPLPGAVPVGGKCFEGDSVSCVKKWWGFACNCMHCEDVDGTWTCKPYGIIRSNKAPGPGSVTGNPNGRRPQPPTVTVGAGCGTTDDGKSWCWIEWGSAGCYKVEGSPWTCCIWIGSDAGAKCASAELPKEMTDAVEKLPPGSRVQIQLPRLAIERATAIAAGVPNDISACNYCQSARGFTCCWNVTVGYYCCRRSTLERAACPPGLVKVTTAEGERCKEPHEAVVTGNPQRQPDAVAPAPKVPKKPDCCYAALDAISGSLKCTGPLANLNGQKVTIVTTFIYPQGGSIHPDLWGKPGASVTWPDTPFAAGLRVPLCEGDRITAPPNGGNGNGNGNGIVPPNGDGNGNDIVPPPVPGPELEPRPWPQPCPPPRIVAPVPVVNLPLVAPRCQYRSRWF